MKIKFSFPELSYSKRTCLLAQTSPFMKVRCFTMIVAAKHLLHAFKSSK